jgi:serine/threonine-protein kinase
VPEADLVGVVLDGRYRVIEPIGHGAMGIVYRGERVKLGRAVAIKVLHDELPHELAGRKRFELEARAMAQLEHPHCVAVLDVGLHEGRPYVVMDFASGTDLRKLLGDTGRLEPERAVGLVRQVLSGLAHAHELGIVHRDIKPANLMVGHKTGIGDQLKILDFGLARSLDPDAKKMTGGIVLGTPSYMAPEQIRGAVIDARTDLYAVGVLLFELLTGRKPFESAADDPVEVVGKHLHTPPPRLVDIVPEVKWGALEEVVARALAKTPEARYPNAAELSGALEAAIARNE